jgi:hypothetical protein
MTWSPFGRGVGPATFVLAAATLWLVAAVDSRAQQSFATGQNIAPAYEGWERNDDGTFSLVFGYLNRNWEEEIDVPIGPNNNIDLGGPDRGQPTHFYPRRNRFVFRIRVPADFGANEVVWTLTVNGTTERAYGTLKRDYFIDEAVVQANYGAGGAAGSTPELPENQAPTLTIEGARDRRVRVGEALTLVAVSTDDGKPRARPIPPSSLRNPGRITTDTATGHRLSWFVYRGAGDVTFEPAQIKVWEDTRDGQNSPWSPGWKTPKPPEDGRWVTNVTFAEPGAYVLRAIAHDGGLATLTDVTVTVTP